MWITMLVYTKVIPSDFYADNVKIDCFFRLIKKN